jgi:hypothetical protein
MDQAIRHLMAWRAVGRITRRELRSPNVQRLVVYRPTASRTVGSPKIEPTRDIVSTIDQAVEVDGDKLMQFFVRRPVYRGEAVVSMTANETTAPEQRQQRLAPCGSLPLG